ncbi:GNAT family N-acetyltransferase [Streptacidiphilus sp. ASG 303]|uniref:GNAT family N-acetyltransferase n=1 Tax=Streptacidiphilus sp. ASG 303 TaxID=2896847 RepID=UPI001E41702C|nr:GNAT family N-acetyltransferase [Streptacidiphilus sp. ASG 303]MCD0481252.1 GNAT family N-acetyltransferase [Streptacidiphilus sp. ASG 303]
MTTTLRPDGPEEPLPGGGRTRRYAVCVNGRPVGSLRAAAHAGPGGPLGEIAGLEVAEGRRRGRGTVAALAAEEVLRGWGCTRVDVAVPEECGGALRLAEALGYRERSRTMAKHLAGPPPPMPEGLTARPVAADAFPAWLAAQQEGYAASLAGSGLSEAQARHKAAADCRALLPDGPDTPGTVLRHLVPEDAPPGAEPLGGLWLRLGGLPGHPGGPAWVLDVEVAAHARGRGYGRALMLLAERCCAEAGVHDLELNVFAGNAAALGLYTSLGYRTTRRTLGKPLA